MKISITEEMSFDENCTFPITAVDSNVTVSVGNITYGDNFTINVVLLLSMIKKSIGYVLKNTLIELLEV